MGTERQAHLKGECEPECNYCREEKRKLQNRKKWQSYEKRWNELYNRPIEDKNNYEG